MKAAEIYPATLGTLLGMWLWSTVHWWYWRGEAAEWKARADERKRTVDRLYAERDGGRESIVKVLGDTP